jgi:hypothetical protein
MHAAHEFFAAELSRLSQKTLRRSQNNFIALHHKATPNFPNVQTMQT